MAKLVFAVRYIAVFALMVSILLIIVRARFPVEDRSQGTLAYLRDIWRRLQERNRDKRERVADLRALRGKTALLIDPDDKSTRIMSWRLETWKCRILSTSKGSKGLGLAKTQEIDFVIVDALLTDISAQDIYHSIGRHDIPVVFVGVLDSQYDELRGLGRNTRCFGKPYNPDEVLALAGCMLRSKTQT